MLRLRRSTVLPPTSYGLTPARRLSIDVPHFRDTEFVLASLASRISLLEDVEL